MRRSVLAMVLAMSMCSVPVCAQEVTVESIQDGMAAYEKTVSSAAMNLTLNLDTTINVNQAGTSVSAPATIKGDMDIQFVPSDMMFSVNGSMDVSAMGDVSEVSFDLYGIPANADTGFDVYMNAVSDGEESGWTYQFMDMQDALDAGGVSSIRDLWNMTDSMDTENELPIVYTLDDSGDDYQMSSSFALSEMASDVEDAVDATVPVDPSMIREILDAFRMNIVWTVEKDTFAPKNCHIDFNDSDLTFLNTMIGELVTASDENAADTEVNLVLNDCSMDMAFTYNDVAGISVPNDALMSKTADSTDIMAE